jgi:hypothetical protein
MPPAKFRRSQSKQSEPGLAVDYTGERAFDPSANVNALNEATNKRQDDLRAASGKRQDDLRGASEKLTRAELRHVVAMAKLRAEHAKEMRHSEAERLNSIRLVDVAYSKTEAERALQAIQALAATTTANAENIRSAMQATAATLAKQTSDAASAVAKQTADSLTEITNRIGSLEKTSYLGAGKQAVVDPQLLELMTEMKKLSQVRDEGTGKGTGVNWIGALIVGGAVVLFGALTTALSFYAVFKPH